MEDVSSDHLHLNFQGTILNNYNLTSDNCVFSYRRCFFVLRAQNVNGKLIWANEALSKEDYYCPSCHKKLIIKKGNLKQTHFAHIKKNCESYSEGETDEHLKGKLEIANLFEKAGYRSELESYDEVLRQRPDIIIQNEFKKSVIEFQCAALSVKKMKERSLGYKKAKINFLWILGQHYLLKKKMTQQIAKFLLWRTSLGYYLIYYLTSKKKFRLLYGIQQTDYLPLKYRTLEFSSVVSLKKFFVQGNSVRFLKISNGERVIQLKAFEIEKLRSQGKFRNIQIKWYLVKQKIEKFRNLYFSNNYSPPIFVTKELYWKNEVIYLFFEKKVSSDQLYYKAIFECEKYMFEVPIIDRERIARTHVKIFLDSLKNGRLD